MEWFSTDETVAQLTELLQSYRDFHLHRADIDQHELKACEDRANVAQDTFRAMFKGRLEDELFISQSQEESVIETLRLWAGELGPSTSGQPEVHHSLADCSRRLAQPTSEENSTQESAKWPYMRKIKFVLSALVSFFPG